MDNGKTTCFQVSLKISSYSDTWHLCSPITVIVYIILLQNIVKTITVIGEHKCQVIDIMLLQATIVRHYFVKTRTYVALFGPHQLSLIFY